MKRRLTLLVLVVLLALPTVAMADDCECPENTELVAKFEWDEGNGTYVFEKPAGNENVVTIVGDETGGTWTSTIPVAAVVIKGATGCHTYDPATTNRDFSKEDLPDNPGGQKPDISNIQFCKEKPTVVGLANFAVRNARSEEWPFGTPWPWLLLGLGVMATGTGWVVVVLRRKGELN